MQRQRQLERCGWEFFRVRESAFYSNKENAIAGLWQALEERGIFSDSRCENATLDGDLEQEDFGESNGDVAEDDDQQSQTWQMTRGEFHESRVLQGFTNPTENSRLYWQQIKNAIADEKPLPPRVLQEYEQLFGRY